MFARTDPSLKTANVSDVEAMPTTQFEHAQKVTIAHAVWWHNVYRLNPRKKNYFTVVEEGGLTIAYEVQGYLVKSLQWAH